jgi:hypothetical protein
MIGVVEIFVLPSENEIALASGGVGLLVSFLKKVLYTKSHLT